MRAGGGGLRLVSLAWGQVGWCSDWSARALLVTSICGQVGGLGGGQGCSDYCRVVVVKGISAVAVQGGGGVGLVTKPCAILGIAK